MRKSVLACLGLAAAALLASCSGSGEGAGKVVDVTIPSYMTGENVGAVFFLPQVERFNKKYEGKYHLGIEACPQASYADKIKQLAQQKKLPVLIHQGGSGTTDVEWFKKVAIKNNMSYDLSSWIKSNEAVKSILIKDSIDYCTANGKVVCLPLYTIRPMGLYYNSSLYAPAKPIRQMAMDEFLSSLGKGRIAFQTVDNAWTTGLFLSGIIANQPGGYELLQKYAGDKLYDYSAEPIVAGVDKLQRLMKSNASANSIGAAYADAANSFMSSQSAMIANGPWMASEFEPASSTKWSKGFDGAKVRADLFPGDIGLANARAYGGWWVANNAPKAQKELALKYLEFIMSPEEVEAYILAEGGSAPNLKYSDSFVAERKKSRVLSDLSEATTAETRFCPSILDVMPSSVSDMEFGKLLPKLADGSLSAAQFCEELSKKAEATK